MSEPGQAPRLPDQAGNIEDEVPPHLVAQMMQMIADLKVGIKLFYDFNNAHEAGRAIHLPNL